MTPRIVVPEDAPREVWLAERGEGVTASDAWEIARGGIRTWRRILEGKLNGSRFKGTAATRAGSSREAALLDEVAAKNPLATVTPNGALWAARSNDLHRATPDGVITIATHGEPPTALIVVEVKSHEFGWKAESIPPDHMGQLQWQMHVLGAASGLYGFEVRDEDDMPPLDGATWIPVERDEEMIAWLIERADAFIAWRDAGCPDVDDLPEAIAELNAKWAEAKIAFDAAAEAEKTANAALKAAIAKHYPHAARFGAVAMGEAGGFQLLVSESVSPDLVAWEAANRSGYRRAQEMAVALASAEAAAKRAFPKISRKTSLRFQKVETDA